MQHSYKFESFKIEISEISESLKIEKSELWNGNIFLKVHSYMNKETTCLKYTHIRGRYLHCGNVQIISLIIDKLSLASLGSLELNELMIK